MAVQALGSAGDFGSIVRPGSIVQTPDVDGVFSDMHILCMDNDDDDYDSSALPTVLLESAINAPGPSSWALVQPLVASGVRVCSYDRRGYGWSWRGPNPRHVRQFNVELDDLLTRVGLPKSLVYVGWGYGGMAATSYAHNYPKQVHGVVFVDALHPRASTVADAADTATVVVSVEDEFGFDAGPSTYDKVVRFFAPLGFIRMGESGAVDSGSLGYPFDTLKLLPAAAFEVRCRCFVVLVRAGASDASTGLSRVLAGLLSPECGGAGEAGVDQIEQRRRAAGGAHQKVCVPLFRAQPFTTCCVVVANAAPPTAVISTRRPTRRLPRRRLACTRKSRRMLVRRAPHRTASVTHAFGRLQQVAGRVGQIVQLHTDLGWCQCRALFLNCSPTQTSNEEDFLPMKDPIELAKFIIRITARAAIVRFVCRFVVGNGNFVLLFAEKWRGVGCASGTWQSQAKSDVS